MPPAPVRRYISISPINEKLGRAKRRKASSAALAAIVVLSASCEREVPLVSLLPGASRSVVLRNVRVFDSPRATLLEGLRDVVVRDGRIDAVGSPGLAAPGLPEIDGHAGTLLP